MAFSRRFTTAGNTATKLRFNALKDDPYGVKSAWILEQKLVQKQGTCYAYSSLLCYAFRQSRANLQAGFTFGQNDFDVLHKNCKTLVMEQKGGSFFGGFRDDFLGYLSSNGDGGVQKIKGEGPMMQDIIQNGPLTSGIHLPMDFRRKDCLDKPYKHRNGGTILGGHHAFVIYGWDMDANGHLHWLCKNSWENQQWFAIYFNQDLGVEDRAIAVCPVAKSKIEPINADVDIMAKKYDEKMPETGDNYVDLLQIGGDWGWDDLGPTKYPSNVPEWFKGGDFGWDDEKR